MSYQITAYGDHQFDLKYKDEKLLEIIKNYICDKKTHGEMYFTYYTLCRFILYRAKKMMLLRGLPRILIMNLPMFRKRIDKDKPIIVGFDS